MTFKRHSRSSGMTRFDRAPIYFLLIFHINYGPISQRFRDAVRLLVENRIFWYHTSIWRPCWGWLRRNFIIGSPVEKYRMMGPPGDETSLQFDDKFSHFDTIHQRERRTDGRTDTARQQRLLWTSKSSFFFLQGSTSVRLIVAAMPRPVVLCPMHFLPWGLELKVCTYPSQSSKLFCNFVWTCAWTWAVWESI